MIYRLLGDLQVGPDGEPLSLPGGPARILLSALLIKANQRLPKADLIRVMWGGEMDEAQLHKRVGEVRGLLRQIGRDGDIVTIHGFGYELRAGDEDIDTLAFQRLVASAHAAKVRGSAAEELALLREAQELWRGPHPLANVDSEAFRGDTDGLEQRRRRAAARLFDLELGRGMHEHAGPDLARIAGFYPEDQALAEQLMLAEYRAGRHADVTRAYGQHAAGLEVVTGASPDRLLRDFHYAVARGDDEAASQLADAIARRRSLPALPRPSAVLVPRQLPLAPELVGRDDLIAELAWLLRPGQDYKVLVITGAGGMGKTALALRAASDCAALYPGGQLHAELRSPDGTPADTAEVAAGFLRALGISQVPDARAERLAAYRTVLADRSVLIMLDDAASAAQVADLVPNSAGCSVLVTSRARLPELGSAHHVAALAPLLPADATELFLGVVRRAGIVLPSLEDVGKVVELCGGLPLALRIAGALRVHEHPRPTAALARRLESQGPEGFAYGELNVARTIGAGFGLLDAAARDLFLGLGLLRLSAFGLWTAAALLPGGDPVAALSQLAARFMITTAEPDARYGFHDLTRAYARNRAQAERPGAERAVAAHAYGALLTLTRRAHERLYGAQFDVVHSGLPDWDAPEEVLASVDADPLAWFETERENIRAAVEHGAGLGLAAVCWDLAVSAHEFYTIRGYHDDWQVTHAAALDACRRAGDRRGEAMVLTCRNQPALVASMRADGAASLAELERAAGLLAEAGDVHGRAIALRTLGNALRRQGYLHRPLELFREAREGFAACGDRAGWWQAQRFIGQAYLDLGRPAEAREALAAAEAVASAAGWARLLAQTRYWLGQALLADPADTDAAAAAIHAVHEAFRDDGGGAGLAYALHGLGDLARCQGKPEEAEQHLTAAADLARDAADAALQGRVLLSLAAVHEAQGRSDDQVAALQQALTALARRGQAYLEARALRALARVHGARGEAEPAAAAADRAGALLAALPEEDR